MADPTVSPPVSVPSSATATALEHVELGVRQLIEAGVHFGHQTRRWDPRMKPFLFGERNGVHILDLDQTLPRFRTALDFVRDAASRGGKTLFVATKRQAQAPVQIEAARAGQYYVNNRWLGGMLTNFKTVKKSIERFKELLATTADETKIKEISKKDVSAMVRAIEKYRKSLDGIREMSRLPDVVFVIDVNREAIAISEAQRLGIPIVAIVDSNCNPYNIDYVVPGNDDSIRAIQLYCSQIADACLEGAEIYNDRLQSEAAEAERVRPAKTAAAGTSTGRVVVEITHPPRRGRGAGASYGGDRREAEAPEPEVIVKPPAGEA